MKQPSQEDLLGYVLGALDAQEQRDVQQSIDENPQLEEQLLELRTSLLPFDYLDTAGPRPGLARRTCEMVAGHQSAGSIEGVSIEGDLSDEEYDREPETVMSSPTDKSRKLIQFSTWSLPDFAVAFALLAVVAGVLFPTISYTRYNSRLNACQNNLQQIGSALMRFSEANCGCFIEIPRSGPLAASGCFAPILKDGGYIEDDNIFACAGVGQERPINIPTIEIVMDAKGNQLCEIRQNWSGHFGYTIGHCDDERYCPPKSLGRTNVVLVADMPSLHLPGRKSENHCGNGQNCLFEDGHVRFIRGDSIGEDSIFVNDYNLVAPGVRENDNVIAPSHLGRCSDLTLFHEEKSRQKTNR